jgi:hypothetical protein
MDTPRRFGVNRWSDHVALLGPLCVAAPKGASTLRTRSKLAVEVE